MTPELLVEIMSAVFTVLGLVLIWRQIESAREDAFTNSFISAVTDHWMAIEERRMQIRTGDFKVAYRFLPEQLEILLSTQYRNDLTALAKDFLFYSEAESLSEAILQARDLQIAKLVALGQERVFDEVTREYAYQDLVFNLSEEEFVAGRYLRIVDERIWRYWEQYIRRGFRSPVRQNHWRLRQLIGKTFDDFARYVEEEYLAKEPPWTTDVMGKLELDENRSTK
jgi:hypothetical protein